LRRDAGLGLSLRVSTPLPHSILRPPQQVTSFFFFSNALVVGAPSLHPFTFSPRFGSRLPPSLTAGRFFFFFSKGKGGSPSFRFAPGGLSPSAPGLSPFLRPSPLSPISGMSFSDQIVVFRTGLLRAPCVALNFGLLSWRLCQVAVFPCSQERGAAKKYAPFSSSFTPTSLCFSPPLPQPPTSCPHDRPPPRHGQNLTDPFVPPFLAPSFGW